MQYLQHPQHQRRLLSHHVLIKFILIIISFYLLLVSICLGQPIQNPSKNPVILPNDSIRILSPKETSEILFWSSFPVNKRSNLVVGDNNSLKMDIDNLEDSTVYILKKMDTLKSDFRLSIRITDSLSDCNKIIFIFKNVVILTESCDNPNPPRFIYFVNFNIGDYNILKKNITSNCKLNGFDSLTLEYKYIYKINNYSQGQEIFYIEFIENVLFAHFNEDHKKSKYFKNSYVNY